jgi:two-component system OmpR family response regulator
VVSKAQIRDRVWDYSFDGKVNMVEVYVSYLRKKLDAHGPPLIRTVRGIGYSMRVRPAASDSLPAGRRPAGRRAP